MRRDLGDLACPRCLVLDQELLRVEIHPAVIRGRPIFPDLSRDVDLETDQLALRITLRVEETCELQPRCIGIGIREDLGER